MDQEIRGLFCQIDHHNMPNRIAFQCAPVIAGLKVSNLLTLPAAQDSYVNKELADTSLRYLKLAEDRGRSTFIVYRERELDKWLKIQSNRLLLKEAGFDGCCVDKILCEVKERYQNYVKGKGKYPHEIGVLLGYPAEDVKGFLLNKGKNCPGSGYWKIYSDLAEKKKLFREFDLARFRIMKLLLNGTGLNAVIRNATSVYTESPAA